ncbi:flagellar biosynthesis regulator FlaF [Roseitranquillus sediminis]|uniref:flagellar biosynthesis regulator FlaF n=1 Tax=Roseitranquillus sediminis TaxID=2809051 RepID=UPI001D0BF7EC|nr:flagellar biosynthesis regulator FlaF [Roseitranquillus sediminis]MBM9596114.1 flagellar biosynthesis regulator FlaF [Roseitranquillus sediminis]
MNAYHMARTAYGSATEVRTDRGVEYDTFARVTSALRNGAAAGKQGFSAFAKALEDNRKLWTILAVDVADKGNKLPQSLRAQIFYLSEFTLTHTPRVIRGEASADVLVDINTSVMRGLRGQAQGEAA